MKIIAVKSWQPWQWAHLQISQVQSRLLRILLWEKRKHSETEVQSLRCWNLIEFVSLEILAMLEIKTSYPSRVFAFISAIIFTDNLFNFFSFCLQLRGEAKHPTHPSVPPPLSPPCSTFALNVHKILGESFVVNSSTVWLRGVAYCYEVSGLRTLIKWPRFCIFFPSISLSRSPLEQLEAEKEEREQKLKKMEQEMEQVFEMKVKEKKKKLKDSETEVSGIAVQI